MKQRIFSVIVALVAIASGAWADSTMKFIIQPKSICNVLGESVVVHWTYLPETRDYYGYTNYSSYFRINFDATKLEVYKCHTKSAYDENTGFYYLTKDPVWWGGEMKIGSIVNNNLPDLLRLPTANYSWQFNILHQGDHDQMPLERTAWAGWQTCKNQFFDSEMYPPEGGLAYFFRVYKDDEYIDSDLFFIQSYEEVNITYVYNLPGKAVVTEKVVPNSLGQHPVSWPRPIVDGYSFYYWYYDAECTQPLLASMTLLEDLTLYAKWEKTEEHKAIISNIPDGWTVNGETPTDGSVFVEVGDAVTVKPANIPSGKQVKSIKVVKKQ
jgi:hypothetical protein